MSTHDDTCGVAEHPRDCYCDIPVTHPAPIRYGMVDAVHGLVNRVRVSEASALLQQMPTTVDLSDIEPLVAVARGWSDDDDLMTALAVYGAASSEAAERTALGSLIELTLTVGDRLAP